MRVYRIVYHEDDSRTDAGRSHANNCGRREQHVVAASLEDAVRRLREVHRVDRIEVAYLAFTAEVPV